MIGNKIKNYTPQKGRTTSIFLVTKINDMILEIPFEVQFRTIDKFIRGQKQFISRPKNKNVLEFFINNKKNVFKEISKNRFLVIRYKDIKIE